MKLFSEVDHSFLGSEFLLILYILLGPALVSYHLIDNSTNSLPFLCLLTRKNKKKSPIYALTSSGTNLATKPHDHNSSTSTQNKELVTMCCYRKPNILRSELLNLKQFALKKTLRNILRKPLVPDTWPWGCQLSSMPSSCPHFHIADTLYSTTPFQNRSNLFLWIWF